MAFGENPDGRIAARSAWALLLWLLLAERTVVFLDRLAEPVGHLIGSRQRQRIVAVFRLAPQREFELLQAIDRRRLQFFQALRIGEEPIVVEHPQVANDVVEFAHGRSRRLQLPAQRVGVVGPIAVLAAPLADVVRIPASVAVAVPVARVAVAGRSVGAAAAVGLPALLAALTLLTLGTLLTLLARLA